MRRCAVCQMEFEDGDEVATLPCTHFYHPNCIGQWLKDRKVRLAPCGASSSVERVTIAQPR